MSSLNSAGRVISALMFSALLIGLPSALKVVWPSFLALCDLMSKKLGGTTQLWAYVFVANTSNIVALVGYNLCLYWVYTANSPFFQQFRVNSKRAWPWEGNKEEWHKFFRRTIRSVFINSFLLNLIVTFGEYFLHDLRYAYTLADWPTAFELATQFLFFFLFNEVVSFCAHWALHLPALYPIHKRHHEYNTTISITATYAHPIEYLFANVMSSGFSIPILSLLTQVHVVTAAPWIIFRILETAQAHSGYEFPWGVTAFLPYRNEPAFHDFHHSHNSGNFGSMLPFMDSIMKTDTNYLKYRDSRKLA